MRTLFDKIAERSWTPRAAAYPGDAEICTGATMAVGCIAGNSPLRIDGLIGQVIAGE